MRTGTLSGLEALVAGGGTGIGAACAAALTAAGARVTVLGRREAPLRAVGRNAAQAAVALPRRRDRAPPALPAFAILVNAAGAAESAPFLKSDDAALRADAGALNLMGAVTLTRAVLPGMLAGRLRPRGAHRLHRRAEGLSLCQRLCRGQARAARPDPCAGAGGRHQGRHGERRLPWLHRHRHGGGERRAHRREDRPRRGRGARRARRSTIRSAAWCGRRRSRRPCCCSARLAPPPSTARRSRWTGVRREPARRSLADRRGCRDGSGPCAAGAQGRAAALAAAAHLHDAGRGRDSRAGCGATSTPPCPGST